MVLLSIGVRPATALAQQAGLKLGEMGGIWVDEHLETSEKTSMLWAMPSNILIR